MPNKKTPENNPGVKRGLTLTQTKQDNTSSSKKKKSLLKSALQYARAGFKVFPCRSGRKDPDGFLVEHGHNDGSLEAKQIIAWWTKHPNANIGLVPPKGYAIIDIDPRDGGLETAKRFKLPNTLVARSGGKDHGFHYFYKDAPHLPGKLGPGIQLKANGTGYVIAPPSIHPSGGQYRWDTEFDPEMIASWPEGLLVSNDCKKEMGKSESLGLDSDLNTLLTPSQLRQILEQIGADDYDDWVAVGQALKRDYSEEGFGLWELWSKHSKKFPGTSALAKKWESFKRNDRGTGTLVFMAGGRIPKAAPEEEFEALPKDSGLVVTELSSKSEKAIDWLVPGYFAKGMLHCIAGFGGDGKSSVASAILSAITNGKQILDDKPLAGGPVSVLIATEEPIEQQTLPRLKLAGANIHRVKLLEGVRENDKVVAWNLADHILKAKAHFQNSPDIQFFEIDPIGNYMESRKRKRDMNSWNDTDVRAVLGPWQKLAEELNICIVFLAHFNKGKAVRAIEKVMGSAAFTTTTRFTYLVGKPGSEYLEGFGYEKSELGEDRVMLSIKRNIGRDPHPIVFGIETHNGDVDGNPKVTVKGILPRDTKADLEQLIMGGEANERREGGTKNVDRVLQVIQEGVGVTRRQIAELTKISEENVSKHLKELGDKITKIRNGQEVWIFTNDSPLLTIF